MQAVLKGLYSDDIANIENYVPDEEDNFGFVLRAMVGPLDEEGEESFDIVVCTPKWLAEKYGPSEVLLGLHKLIVFKYNFLCVRGFIEKFLMRCSGNSWEEIGQKVSLLGQWEFEGYRPNPLVW
jgi:Immunity protein 8